MDFDIENLEDQKRQKDSRVTKVLNKNLEQYQYPRYDEYKSMVGFSNMNYSRVLQNTNDIQYMKNQRNNIDDSLNKMYQYKFNSNFYEETQIKKPFQQALINNRNQEQQLENDYVQIKDNSDIYNKNIKDKSKFLLQNSSLDYKLQQTKDQQEYYEKFSQFKPVNSQIKELNFEQEIIPSVDTINYTLINQNEEEKHLKSLNNKIITECSLQQILNMELVELNLQNHTWIPMNLISKIGFLAKNIQKLNLSGLLINDDILLELTSSCNKLAYLDISLCQKLTEKGVCQSLNNLADKLVLINGYGNSLSFTNNSLEPLSKCSKLQYLNLGYCNSLDKSNKIQLKNYLLESKCSLISIELSRCASIEISDIADVIGENHKTLEIIDVSYIQGNDLNKLLMKEVQKCQNLIEFDITGCFQISDEQFQLILQNERRGLLYLNLCGVKDISEQSLLKLCGLFPNLKYLNCNGLTKLGDQCLIQISKIATKLQILNINNTPNVTPECIKEIQENRNINQIQIQIFKNHHKNVDPKFNGLLMPFISIAKQNALIKVKKKKKKK